MKFETPKYTQEIGQKIAAKELAFAERVAGTKRAFIRLARILAVVWFLILVFD